MKVRDVMTPDPQTIAPTETLATARELMDRGRFRRLPVVDGQGQLLGILTDRDVREHAGHLRDTRVTGAMIEPALTAAPDDAIDAVADRMLRLRVGGFPVVDAHGMVVGMVSETDVLRALLRRYREARRALEALVPA